MLGNESNSAIVGTTVVPLVDFAPRHYFNTNQSKNVSTTALEGVPFQSLISVLYVEFWLLEVSMNIEIED